MLTPSPGCEPAPSLLAQAQACEAVGIELAWLPGADSSAALHHAALVAAGTTSLRLAAVVAVGGHPLRIAEEAAVADNCADGRLTLVLAESHAPNGASLLAETADVVLAAAAGAPFRHQGRQWTIPAGLAANERRDSHVTVTPPSPQPEPPVWLAGPAAPVVARERGLSHVAAEDDDADAAGAAWRATELRLGAAAARLRRPALRRVPATATGQFEAPGLVAELTAERQGWGLDTVIFVLPAGLDDAARCAAVTRLAQRVRPRTVLHALPAGLERHWDEVLDSD